MKNKFILPFLSIAIIATMLFATAPVAAEETGANWIVSYTYENRNVYMGGFLFWDVSCCFVSTAMDRCNCNASEPRCIAIPGTCTSGFENTFINTD